MPDLKDNATGSLRRFSKPKDGAPELTQFRDALTREILLTERLRVKAVIITTSVLVAATSVLHLIDPSVLDRLSHGQFSLVPLNAVYVPFLLYELFVLRMLTERLKARRDVPVLRRYLSALIETSIPTFVLHLHMNWMGPEQALGFAAPLGYFLFIILSTLRLDFWLSTFTGFVAAAQLLAMAMFYHPVAFAAEPPPQLGYELIRSTILLIGGILAGAVGVQLRYQFEASIAAAGARDRITNLFGQHVSPAVVERLLTEGSDKSSNIRHVAVMFVDFRGFTAGARHPHAAGSRRSSRWRVRGPGRDSRPSLAS